MTILRKALQRVSLLGLVIASLLLSPAAAADATVSLTEDGTYVTIDGTGVMNNGASSGAVKASSRPQLSSLRGVAVCGATREVGADNGCPTQKEIIEYTTLRRVRCCSDTDLGPPWGKRNSCSIWGATSNTGGANTVEDYQGCSGPLNFYDAMAYCDDVGGRLCTSDELVDDCTAGTGCIYDRKMIWSSSASSQPPTSPQLSNQRGVAVCGRTNRCSTQKEIIENTTLRRVRCCSDTDLGPPWGKRDNCSIWGATSNTGGANTVEDYQGCSGPLNFYDAMAYCDDVGGRLCTPDELVDDCTAGTGCNYDNHMIWSDSLRGSAKCITSSSGPIWGTEASNSFRTTYRFSDQFDIVRALYSHGDGADNKERYEAEKHTLVSFKVTGSDDKYLRHQNYYLRPLVSSSELNTPQARLDASFYMTHEGGNKYSFRSVNLDTFFISPEPDKLLISPSKYIWDVESCTALSTRGKDPPDTSSRPLGLCAGDCDSDEHCEEGLVCFERSGFDSIPGCAGTGVKEYDYCVNPPEPSTALDSTRGRNPTDTSSRPLGLCAGDCDSDEQCAEGLVCYFREKFGSVPGCGGDGRYTWDYCVNPLGLCDNNCESDAQCAEGLVCFKSDGLTYVPGCDGVGVSEYNYCIDPKFLAPNELKDTITTELLGLCTGDCDSDEHCEEGLVCFERDGFTSVPGCDGVGLLHSDYCIIPPI